MNPPEHHADVGSAPPVTPAPTRRILTIGIVVTVILAALLLGAFLPRHAVSKELAAEVAGEDAPIAVQVGTVARAAEGGEVELPATIQALHEGVIYARVSGYVRQWRYDIGSIVHKGDVLAELDAPELKQEVAQAQHQLDQARTSQTLARADLDRWKLLAADSAVTRQEFDQKQAAFDAAASSVGSAAANLQRLTEMENFTRVTAPFTGVVTARNVDLGSLITAAGASSASVAGNDLNGQQGAGSMFRIAETDTVRAYISVPENYAPSMSDGLQALVDVREIPGRTFHGKIVRTSHAIDVASRTLLTEIDIANPGFALLPGMYAQVRVKFPHSTPSLIIPAAALVIRAAGTQVITVDRPAADQTAIIHFRTVQVGRDYGARMEIPSGLTEGETIVTNPNADLVDGMKVRIAPAVAEGEKTSPQNAQSTQKRK